MQLVYIDINMNLGYHKGYPSSQSDPGSCRQNLIDMHVINSYWCMGILVGLF